MGRENNRRNHAKRFVKFDQDNFDFRPCIRRSNCGLAGMAARLACRGDLGSSENKSSNQTDYQQQVTIQGGAAGSTTVGVGAGSTVNYTSQSLDASVAQAAADFSSNALNVASSATTNAEITAGAAISASSYDLNQSLGFGAEVVQGSNDVANNAIAANSKVVNGVLTLGAEALNTTTTLNAQDLAASQNNIDSAYNFAAGTVNQIEGDNANQAGYYAQSIQNLGADLAYASGVTNPAQQALATPIVQTAAATGGTDWTSLAVIGGVALSAFAFLNTRGRAT